MCHDCAEGGGHKGGDCERNHKGVSYSRIVGRRNEEMTMSRNCFTATERLLLRLRVHLQNLMQVRTLCLFLGNGHEDPPCLPLAGLLDDLYVFSPSSCSWTMLSPYGSVPPVLYKVGFTATPNGMLYLFGGADGKSRRGASTGGVVRSPLRTNTANKSRARLRVRLKC